MFSALTQRSTRLSFYFIIGRFSSMKGIFFKCFSYMNIFSFLSRIRNHLLFLTKDISARIITKSGSTTNLKPRSMILSPDRNKSRTTVRIFTIINRTLRAIFLIICGSLISKKLSLLQIDTLSLCEGLCLKRGVWKLYLFLPAQTFHLLI